MTTIYTTLSCPRCKQLSNYLSELGIRHEEKMLDTAAMADYLCEAGRPVLSAPLMQVASFWYGPEELFSGGELDREKVKKIFMC